MTNADIRLELFDGERWFPMEYPRDDERITYEAVSADGRHYVEAGAATGVRVQLRRNGEWITVKTIEVQIVTTLGPAPVFCTCGHAEASHNPIRNGCQITLSSRVCPCERFEPKAG